MTRSLKTALVMVLLMAVLIVVARSLQTTHTPPATPTVIELANSDLAEVGLHTLTRQLALTGTIRSLAEAHIASAVGGELKSMLKREGDVVHRHELIAQFDDTKIKASLHEAEANIAALQAQVRLARQNQEHATQLLAEQFISNASFNTTQANFEMAQANLSAAQARLALLRQQLAETQIRAPFDGVIAERFAKAGDWLAKDKIVLTLVDPQHLEVEASLPTPEIQYLHPPMPVALSISHTGAPLLKGTLQRIAPAVNSGTRTASIYIALAPTTHPPPVGAFIEGHITLTNPEPVLAIPNTAVHELAGQQIVYRLQGNTLQAIPVTVGDKASSGDWVAIKQGLTIADRIVSAPLGKLQDGATFRIVDTHNKK